MTIIIGIAFLFVAYIVIASALAEQTVQEYISSIMG